MSNKRLKAFGGVETWFHSPPELGGVPFAKQRRGGAEREPDRVKHQELFKDEQYRLMMLSHLRDGREAFYLIGTVRL